MEHKVSHPNPKLSQEKALEQLFAHPQFPKGAELRGIKRVKGHWEATLEVPEPPTPQSSWGSKTAAPPPFPPKSDDSEDEEEESGPPKKPAFDDSESPPDEDAGPPKPDGDKKPGKGGEKVELGEIRDLVQQIAEAVGVTPDLGLDEEGLDGPPHPPGHPSVPPGAGAGGPPAPAGPGGKPPAGRGPTRGLRPGEAPPGTTPVGAPSFASTGDANLDKLIQGGVRSFIVSDTTDKPIGKCAQEIQNILAPHGYRVQRVKEGVNEDGKRLVRAKVLK